MVGHRENPFEDNHIECRPAKIQKHCDDESTLYNWIVFIKTINRLDTVIGCKMINTKRNGAPVKIDQI